LQKSPIQDRALFQKKPDNWSSLLGVITQYVGVRERERERERERRSGNKKNTNRAFSLVVHTPKKKKETAMFHAYCC